MSDELLERFIAEYIASQDNYTVFFTWQGGEPTLVELEFYRKVVELQRKHAWSGVAIANALQTNGVLLDEAWCRFLAEQRWAVGISIDGPEEIHDHFRRFRGGSSTHVQVLRAVRLLQQHRVRFDTLATVTSLSVGKAAELYDYDREDRDILTGPVGLGMWRHFRSLEDVTAQLNKDMKKCDASVFSRHMHQMQDYFSHYRQGYRWPTLGHGGDSVLHGIGIGSTNPDDPVQFADDLAQARDLTRIWEERWRQSCGCSK